MTSAQSLSQSTMRAELGLLVPRLARLWRRKADQALIAHGLSEAVAHPLLILSRRGKCVRQGVLADEMGIEGPSLVRLIDLLQADGLVERREDPTDRRAKLLYLTALGEAKANDIDRVLGHLRNELLHGISPEHLAITFETLRTIERRTGDQADAATQVAP